MKILKKLLGRNDIKISASEIAVEHNKIMKLLPEISIESTGENSNGRWTKFGDGTLIQYCSKIVGPIPNIASGAIFRSDSFSITYPMSFSTNQTPAVSVFVDSDAGFTWTGLGNAAAGNQSVTACIFSATKGANPSKISLVAIGRWK